MKTYIITILAYAAIFFTFSCAPVTPSGTSPAAVAGGDLNALAAQATQAYVDYQHGDTSYAHAVAVGLYAYQTLIKTKADVMKVVTMMGGSGTLAEKLASLFASGVAPATLANSVSVTSTKQP